MSKERRRRAFQKEQIGKSIEVLKCLVQETMSTTGVMEYLDIKVESGSEYFCV